MKLLIGGSPCTHWSIAKTHNRETKAEGLGWELFQNYVIALQKYKPDYFLYENNKSMSKDIRKSIDETFGFEAVLINSALVSAQNRQRLYWVGKRNEDGTYSKVDIEQPDDRGILLRDILESGVPCRNEKSYCIDANYYKGGNLTSWNKQSGQRNMVAEPVCMRYACIKHLSEKETDYLFRKEGRTEYGYIQNTNRDKAQCITANIHKGVPYNTLFEKVAEPICVPIKPLTEKEMDYMVGDHEGYSDRWSFLQKPGQEDKALCLVANIHKGIPYNVCAEPVCVAERGRQATSDSPYEQHFEAREDGKTNTLTQVAKDNQIAEPVNVTDDGKSHTLKAQYYKNGTANFITNNGFDATAVAEPIRVGTIESELKNKDHDSKQYRVYSPDGKSTTLCGQGGGVGAKTELYAVPTIDTSKYPIYEVRNGMITIKGKQYPIKLKDGYYIIRKLTVLECMRLQTVPEWYAFPVSNSQSYKMLGNGWTVEVIKHLMSHMDGILDEELDVLSMYDGMSCGQIALKELGCAVRKYYSTEIDKYAIQTTQHNFPNTIQIGDAFQVREEGWSL